MRSRRFSAIGLLSILLLASCHAQEQLVPSSLSQDVEDSSRIASDTVLDNAYLVLKVGNDKRYYAGFIVESDGRNIPALVEVDVVTGKQASWNFEAIISDIFVFNSHVSVAFDKGETQSLVAGSWKRNALVLPANARIVFSDGRERLIACSPSSLAKADTREGGCESYNPHWKASFSWHNVRPKVCGELLHAVTWSTQGNQRLAIKLDSGEVVHRAVYAGEDICTPFGG